MSDAFDKRSPISLTYQRRIGSPEPRKAFSCSHLMQVTSWHPRCGKVRLALRKVLHFWRRKFQAFLSPVQARHASVGSIFTDQSHSCVPAGPRFIHFSTHCGSSDSGVLLAASRDLWPGGWRWGFWTHNDRPCSARRIPRLSNGMPAETPQTQQSDLSTQIYCPCAVDVRTRRSWKRWWLLAEVVLFASLLVLPAAQASRIC